jgi:AcrR family transcriptional regulator
MGVLPAAQLVEQPHAVESLSDRQQQVLASALDLMVEEGDAFSMAAVARRANCSKETLYKWFGDRNGMLTATVRWQAAKVAMPHLPAGTLTREALAANLEAFARNWLTVVSSDVSVALNRLAVAHAGSAKSALGRIVRHNGPYAMAKRLEPVFLAGREAKIIDFDRPETAFRCFFGLVVADTQILALLGEPDLPKGAEIDALAARAVERFLTLFAGGAEGAAETDKKPAGGRSRAKKQPTKQPTGK